jgi:hypothetical protein
MTLRELGQSISKWFQDVWNTIIWFFVDMYKKIWNGDFFDLTLWQVGFLLVFIVVWGTIMMSVRGIAS